MPNTPDRTNAGPVIGLIPAAGYATRLSPLPCSKELYPIGLHPDPDGNGARPKVVSHYLLEKMRLAGIEQAYFILRDGKWDIPAYFRDGGSIDMHLGYLLVTVPYGVPYTLDQAYPFVRHARVALGFPDILFSPDDAFATLLAHQAKRGADVVLGLFPAGEPSTMDMVAVDTTGAIKQIVIKPRQSDLKHTWGIAVWSPTFTEFMHSWLRDRSTSDAAKTELYIGEVIQHGINAGLKVEGIMVSQRPYLDIGIPENLARALRSDDY